MSDFNKFKLDGYALIGRNPNYINGAWSGIVSLAGSSPTSSLTSVSSGSSPITYSVETDSYNYVTNYSLKLGGELDCFSLKVNGLSPKGVAFSSSYYDLFDAPPILLDSANSNVVLSVDGTDGYSFTEFVYGQGNMFLGMYPLITDPLNLGSSNLTIGQYTQAWYNDKGDSNNIAIGGGCLLNMGAASIANANNVAIGLAALQNVAGAHNNVVIVDNTAVTTPSTVSGYNNVIFGSNLVAGLTSGHDNIIVGVGSGNGLTTGNSNIIIGKNISTSSGISNTVSIGNTLSIGAADTVTIGGNFVSSGESAAPVNIATMAGTLVAKFDGTDWWLYSPAHSSVYKLSAIAFSGSYLDLTDTPPEWAYHSLSSTGAHIAVDMSAKKSNFTHTLTENTTLDAPTGMVEGQRGIIEFTQNASAAKTLAFNSFYRFYSASATMTTTLGGQNSLVYTIGPGATYAICQWLS